MGQVAVTIIQYISALQEVWPLNVIITHIHGVINGASRCPACPVIRRVLCALTFAWVFTICDIWFNALLWGDVSSPQITGDVIINTCAYMVI